MSKQQLDLAGFLQYLQLLDRDLKELGFKRHVKLLVIGGFYMIVNIQNRNATEDIDSWIFDPGYHENDYEIVKNAALFIAEEHGLQLDWLNDKTADFLAAAGSQRLPPCSEWKEGNKQFQVLRIYFPEMEYILALKLVAARPKDMNDIQILCQRCHIRTKEQARALINRYIVGEVQQDYNLESKLGRVFAR